MTAEAKPVAARDLADIADRAASDLPGQLEDLSYGQDWPFGCALGPGAADPTWVAWEELADRARLVAPRSVRAGDSFVRVSA